MAEVWDLGAALVGRQLLYWLPDNGWQRGTPAVGSQALPADGGPGSLPAGGVTGPTGGSPGFAGTSVVA
jgi:hypothetical protein